MEPNKVDLALAQEVLKFLIDKQPDCVEALKALHLASLIILDDVEKKSLQEMS